VGEDVDDEVDDDVGDEGDEGVAEDVVVLEWLGLVDADGVGDGVAYRCRL
jgi:hypothetical protein